MSGALDKLCPSRAKMLASITNAVKYAQRLEEDQDSGQLDLFSLLETTDNKPELVNVPDFSDKYRLALEKSVLGLYLSGHPINVYQDELRFFIESTLDKLKPGTRERPNACRVCGVVIASNERTAKSDGHKFYIITIDDGTSQIEVSLHARAAEEYGSILAQKREDDERALNLTHDDHNVSSPLVLVLNALVSVSEDSPLPRLRIQEMHSLEELRRANASSLILKLSEQTYRDKGELINKLINCARLPLAEYKQMQQRALIEGRSPYQFKAPGCRLQLLLGDTFIPFSGRNSRIDPSDFLIDGIRDAAGNDAVQVNYSQAV